MSTFGIITWAALRPHSGDCDCRQCVKAALRRAVRIAARTERRRTGQPGPVKRALYYWPMVPVAVTAAGHWPIPLVISLAVAALWWPGAGVVQSRRETKPQQPGCNRRDCQACKTGQPVDGKPLSDVETLRWIHLRAMYGSRSADEPVYPQRQDGGPQ